MKKTIIILISLLIVLLLRLDLKAQINLTGTFYTETFDGIGSGLPNGWTVKLHATATSLGTDTVLNTAKTKWANTTKGVFNYASADGLTSASDTTTQMASTDRALGIRQVSIMGDPVLHLQCK